MTMYAQAYRVALEILERPDVIKARGDLVRIRKASSHAPDYWKNADGWSDDLKHAAQLVARTFQSVGTMIRKGMLPASYITDMWSHNIVRCWTLLEDYIIKNRTQRPDPYHGMDFEMLAKAAQDFLDKEKAAATPQSASS